jgi:hypothetical protein
VRGFADIVNQNEGMVFGSPEVIEPGAQVIAACARPEVFLAW